MDMLKIRAIVNGYQGGMLCIYAAMDEASGFLLIDRAEKFNEDMAFTPDLTILTNVSGLPVWTMFFDDKQLMDAVTACQSLEANQLLALGPEVQRYSLSTAVQFNGVGEKGREYRFMESMSNGHVGVMMCCLFAKKQQNIRASLAGQCQVLDRSPLPHAQRRPNDFVIEPVSISFFL